VSWPVRSAGYVRLVPDAQFSQIKYSVADHIATVTLSRPDRLNAFTDVMRRELLAVFDLTDADDDVRAVIVTGDGRAFCAGADLSSGGDTFARGGSEVERERVGVGRDGGGMVTLRIFDSLKPVIAAVNGAAVGVGVTMTLPMDIRIASTSARFGFVFNRRGIVPEAASSWFLPRVVGISQALEWSFSGRVFPAEEALDGGLVRSLHAPDELLPAARSIAAEIAENAAPVSVALTRQMMWRMLGAEHPMQAHRVDSRAIAARGRSADAREGIASFLEKRPATYSDRVSNDLPDVFPGWVDPEY
jgi:enoyl-CoA hydratase/carnithine racemase